MSSTRFRLLSFAAVLVALAAGVVSANAGEVAHSEVVSEHPVDWTPHIQDGTVLAITVVGDTVVVGGDFTEVTDAGGDFEFTRPYLFAFARHDGRLARLRVKLDGPVHALAPGPDGTVYLGGEFRTVNGVPQRGITQIRLATGERVPEFDASINWGRVETMARHDKWVYLGGSFTQVNRVDRPGLARVRGTTGAVGEDFDPGLDNDRGRVNVRDLSLSPDGRRLVAVGAFSHAHGLKRPQLVLLNTSGSDGTLTGWYTDAYQPRCARYHNTYLRGVDFAPDGSYFVAVTTGGMADPNRLCNTAARFDASGTGMHRPVWVNHTGGNTLSEVAVTGAAVYVGGHQQWHDNPHGNKSPGPGAVEREGIAALHPARGHALPWNPGRARGVGVQALHATPEGLFVGSDTTRLGGEYRGRLGMFPLG